MSDTRTATVIEEQSLTGGTAAIGSIPDIEALLQGDAGTTVRLAAAQAT